MWEKLFYTKFDYLKDIELPQKNFNEASKAKVKS